MNRSDKAVVDMSHVKPTSGTNIFASGMKAVSYYTGSMLHLLRARDRTHLRNNILPPRHVYA